MDRGGGRFRKTWTKKERCRRHAVPWGRFGGVFISGTAMTLDSSPLLLGRAAHHRYLVFAGKAIPTTARTTLFLATTAHLPSTAQVSADCITYLEGCSCATFAAWHSVQAERNRNGFRAASMGVDGSAEDGAENGGLNDKSGRKWRFGQRLLRFPVHFRGAEKG